MIGDANVTYSGIYGAILNDEYDRCSKVFHPKLERVPYIDFSIGFIYVRKYYVTDVSKATKFDWTLYLRPFRMFTW